jgi:G3E family GTPase
MSRIPLTIVTGFLGSGKTTLLQQLLQQPGFGNALIVLNEFGEAGIDHDLLEASSDDTVLLANGCLCCTIRGNLVDTLLDVQAQVAQGRLRAFDRVVVETSGVADPAALLGFVLAEESVSAHYRLDGVITTVDAMTGAETLARHPEAVAQAQIADRLLLTKTDLATPAQAEALAAQLRALNPAAPILPVLYGQVAAEAVMGLDTAACFRPEADAHCDDPGHDHSHHTERFRSTTVQATRALSRSDVAALEDAIRAHAGPALLRLKAILAVQDNTDAVMHVAQGLVHPTQFRRGGHGPVGQLVLVTEGAAAPALLRTLAGFGIR